MRKPYDEPMANIPPVESFCRILTSHSISIGTGTSRTMISTVTLKIPVASSFGIRRHWPGISMFHNLAAG